METIKLKNALKTLIDSASSYVAYEYGRVPKTAEFPYATYNVVTPSNALRDSITDYDFILEIDLFDYQESKNTDRIEGFADDVFNTVNRADVITNDIYFRIENNGLLSQLPTPNEFTFRRQIVAVLHYMERS